MITMITTLNKTYHFDDLATMLTEVNIEHGAAIAYGQDPSNNRKLYYVFNAAGWTITPARGGNAFWLKDHSNRVVSVYSIQQALPYLNFPSIAAYEADDKDKRFANMQEHAHKVSIEKSQVENTLRNLCLDLGDVLDKTQDSNIPDAVAKLLQRHNTHPCDSCGFYTCICHEH